MALMEESEHLCPTENQLLGFSPKFQLLPPPQHSVHRQLVPPRMPPVPPTWAVPTAWLSYLLPAPWSCSKDLSVRVKRLGLLFFLPVHQQSGVILPSPPSVLGTHCPEAFGAHLAWVRPCQSQSKETRGPQRPCPRRHIPTLRVWASRSGLSVSGPGTAGRPPGQPQHELIKRHQGRSNLCLGGYSRKTHSSSQPSTVMARTLRDAAPRQRALAHPSLAEHHSYPPQLCFCQIPKPSPAELLTAPAAPRGRHVPPVWVITEAITGPTPALPCHRTSACHHS